MMGGVNLLAIPQVQTELKMTPEQIAKVSAKQQEVRDALRGLGPAGGGQGTPEAMQAMMAKRQEVQTRAVAGILDAAQQKRFRQIELQQQGPLALAVRKDAADELKLTEDQKKSIAAIQKQTDDEMRAARQGANFQNMTPEERTAMTVKTQAIQKASGDKIVALLTEPQKAQWKAMLGLPFKLPAMGGQRGGRAAAPAPPPAAL
jgi:Zn-dependent M32 family carboxypeptidase